MLILKMYVFAASVAFSQSNYNVIESGGFVTVCVELLDGPLVSSLSVMITSTDGKNSGANEKRAWGVAAPSLANLVKQSMQEL